MVLFTYVLEIGNEDVLPGIGVNFMNVKRANFTHECHFGSFFSSYLYVKKAAEMTFVRKIRTYNVDEIDGCSLFRIIIYRRTIRVYENRHFPSQLWWQKASPFCRLVFLSKLGSF